MGKFISFILGGTIGFTAAYFILKDKYEQKINSELLADVVSHNKDDKLAETAEPEKVQETVVEPKAEKKNSTKKASKKLVVAGVEPYLITEEEYTESKNGHASLIYHTPDDALTEYHRGEDPDEVLITNINDYIGTVDPYALFENCEDDFLYVRNEDKKVDYEIMASAKPFKKVKKAPEKEE